MNTNRNYDNEFIVIRTWMMTKLGLKGKNLLVYAVIYNFSQSYEIMGQKYSGSLDYISGITDIPISDVEKILDRLVEKNLILRFYAPKDGHESINVGRNYDYGINKEMIKHI